MSYILEALQKAESERERGVVPGLSSGQTNTTTYITYGSGTPWWLVVLALGAVLALVAGVWAWRQPMPEGAVVAPVSLAPASAPASAPATAASQPVPLADSGPGMVAASTVAPVVAKAPVASPAPSVSLAPLASASAPVTRVEVVTKAVPAPINPPRAIAAAIPMLGELPDSLRRQIPALAISGAIYSDSPAEWTLIINDQVMGKGSQVAQDLRLEDISATSATFSFKGQRFRMDH